MAAFNRDNWGERARIGLFIVASEAVPEAEWWAMAPPGVSIHAARVSAPAPWARWRSDHSHVDLADDLARGCRQFAAMRLSAVVLAHTSSSVVGGLGWDAAVMAAVGAILGEGVCVTTNGLDTVAALRAVGVERPFLVLPPWFGDATVAAAVDYYTGQGFRPAGHLRHDAGEGWRHIPPQDLYAHGKGFAQDTGALYREIAAACPAEADGVFIAGTGFRSVGILAALEDALGRPVVSANQASLWRALRAAGIADSIANYGRLLRLAG